MSAPAIRLPGLAVLAAAGAAIALTTLASPARAQCLAPAPVFLCEDPIKGTLPQGSYVGGKILPAGGFEIGAQTDHVTYDFGQVATRGTVRFSMKGVSMAALDKDTHLLLLLTDTPSIKPTPGFELELKIWGSQVDPSKAGQTRIGVSDGTTEATKPVGDPGWDGTQSYLFDVSWNEDTQKIKLVRSGQVLADFATGDVIPGPSNPPVGMRYRYAHLGLPDKVGPAFWPVVGATYGMFSVSASADGNDGGVVSDAGKGDGSSGDGAAGAAGAGAGGAAGAGTSGAGGAAGKSAAGSAGAVAAASSGGGAGASSGGGASDGVAAASGSSSAAPAAEGSETGSGCGCRAAGSRGDLSRDPLAPAGVSSAFALGVVGFPRRRWRRGSQAERDRRSSPRRAAALVSIGSALALSCTQGSSANPGAAGSATPAATSVIPTAAPSARAAESNPSGSNPAAAEGEELEYDPLEGKFTLADATAGLAGSGKLFADIETSAGTITCELLDDKAPVTVANFVGLARGVRPWRHSLTKRWLKKPAYDGGTFHRVIKGFMIQGGDPLGNGVGEPGYVFKDEIWKGSTHDRAGLLCMANRGRDTNGAQFFITDAACKHLDKAGHTIFGRCGPESVIHKIASTPADARNKPLEPQTIKTVVIRRARNK